MSLTMKFVLVLFLWQDPIQRGCYIRGCYVVGWESDEGMVNIILGACMLYFYLIVFVSKLSYCMN